MVCAKRRFDLYSEAPAVSHPVCYFSSSLRSSLTGSIRIHEGYRCIYETHVDRQLFSVALLELGLQDVGGAGSVLTTVAVASSWDGATFLVSPDRSICNFQFPERLCAFTAGMLPPAFFFLALEKT
jgi:hypothetical protein